MTMQDLFKNYIQAISSKFVHDETSEMGYRTDFEILIKGIFESIKVKRIDHDARAKQGNKPDFVILNNDVPILYIEAKDIGVSLDKIEKSEQMTRYYGYTNLVLTDYIEFRFYRNGLRYEEPIKIANYDLKSRIITPLPENYEHVAKTLLDFTQSQKEPIRSGKHLSKIMGGRAQRIRDNVRQFLATQSERDAELIHVYETIKKLLVHDLTTDAFADMYAQTLVYGLFVARYYDESKKDFSRQEARDLIPKSNPLLRHFFDHIVGPNFDKRLEYIVNELCEVFSHADIQELMKEYFKDDLWGKTQKGPDPVIHFYEDFLQEYDADLRKKMGAYYTPLPVVQFIVRSVDHLLEKEFGLVSGLADTSKTADGIHKVQILDPAVGTGTFVSDIIGKIYERILKGNQQGRWPAYVHNDLLPRLHGFELMMTPYTIAHLKLGIAFRKTGFKYFNQRLGIYLTNSLEGGSIQGDIFTGFGFAESIAEESKEALKIKNDKPIMIVIGNPPYSGESSNAFYKGHDVYKVEPGGKEKLKEKNSKWINDDYVKFIRFAENMVEKNGEGVIAMITAHGYLDNPTFRGMRWHLRNTFDRIQILDLHGNAKKKETTPNGGKDENVFDIQQGVSIILAVKFKNNKNGKLAKIMHADLFGLRTEKFTALENNDIEWSEINPDEHMHFFVKKNNAGKEKYESGFKLDELFDQFSTGILTKNDNVAVAFTKKDIWENVQKFHTESEINLRSLFDLKKDSRDWVLERAIRDIKSNYSENNIVSLSYRPFDNRYTYYTGTSRGFMAYSQMRVMHNLFNRNNLALISGRQGQVVGSMEWNLLFIAKDITDLNIFYRGGGSVFPLYTYDKDEVQTSNLNEKFVVLIQQAIGKITPEDIFDYIYAVLHSPAYREKYKEFLKTDFPRIPYPKDAKNFKALVALGSELRLIHLLESPKITQYITSYPVTGSDEIEKITYKNGKVFINSEQYFGDVPEIAWNFYIGGYQPAQKWLKDRKERTLTNEEIEHYQKMIVALMETDHLMKEIDKIIQS